MCLCKKKFFDNTKRILKAVDIYVVNKIAKGQRPVVQSV